MAQPSIIDPNATNSSFRVGEQHWFTGMSNNGGTGADLSWTVTAGTLSSPTGARVQYTAPSAVTNNQGGNLTTQKVTVILTDNSTHPAEQKPIVIEITQKPTEGYHTNPETKVTGTVIEPQLIPVDNHEDDGNKDSGSPLHPQDEGNQSDHKCGVINYCTCSSKKQECKVCGIKSRPKEEMDCKRTYTGARSEIRSTPDGIIMVQSGWTPLLSRGESIDLAVYHSNAPDGQIAAELPAGGKGSFGWQVRLFQDAEGNAAIYWGDQRVEAWPSFDTGVTFERPAANFNTLTKQGGSFSLRTKAGTYYDFDSAGRLFQIKDRSSDGNVIYYDHNAAATPQVIRIKAPGSGYQAYFSYNGNLVERLTLESSDANLERRTYYRYDASNRMVAMHRPEGAVTYFDYDGDGNLTKEINADGHTAYFWYTSDTIPRILRILYPEGAGMYFSYDDTIPRQGRMQIDTIGSATGPTMYLDYNWAGMPLKRTIADGTGAILETQYFAFDGNAKRTYALWGDGTLAYYSWDSDGQLTFRKECGDDTTYFTYGSLGRITSEKDPRGNVTYWNYNAQGYQTNWIDSLGQTTYFERDSSGHLTSMKDRRGNVTAYSYDSTGRHTATLWPDGTARYYDYDAASAINKLIDEASYTTYYDHDGLGRINQWKDALGQATQVVYDRRSNRTAEIDRRGFAWYWEYDGLSRLVARRTALGHTTYFNYTANNLMSNTVDPRGNPAYMYYDTKKRLTCSENALQERTYYTYDTTDRLTSVKDARGFATYMQYDCHGRKSKSIDAVGQWTYFNYDDAGNVSTQITQDGTTSYTYDSINRVSARVDALGRASYFYYDQEGNKTCSEDALARLSYFYYDSRNREFCLEDAQKNRAYYTYDVRSQRSSLKDPRGNVTYFYQDALGRAFATRDARNGVTYLEFNAESDVVAQKSARGFVSYFTFDNDRRWESTKTPLGDLSYFGYDSAANQTSVKDARGNHEYFYFDSLNRTFCSEDAKQARTYFEYDRTSNRTSVKDPLSRVSYAEYDGLSRPVAAKTPLANVRYFEYLRFGGGASGLRYDTAKNERGYVAYTYFDELLRVKATHSPIGAWTYFEYDRVNNRTAVKDPLSRFNYFYYDSLNRLQAAEDGLQKRSYYEYDVSSNQVSIKNPRLGTETGVQYFTFDQLNRRNSFKTETANVWYYDYDASSNLQVQRSPLSALTYWEYDSLERKVSQKDPLARTWYWGYDAVGNVSSLKDGKAQTTSYVYDSVNLQERVDYPDATKHYYEYDLARQRTAMADPTGRTTFGYDAAGRMISRGNPGSQNVYYEFDAAGNRTNLKDPDGFVQAWSFDGANRMTSAGSAGYGIQPYGKSPYGGYVSNYEFDLASQLNHERRANGAISYFGYDAAGRQGLIQHRKSDGTLIESWTYTRDEAGNITKNVRGSDSMNTYWNYDQASRVTKEAWRTNGGADVYGFTYRYDEAGNRLERRDTMGTPSSTYWDYDLADQTLRQKQDATTMVYFSFDQNGNVSVEHDVDASAGRTYYDYDPRNLLTRVDFPGATATNYFQFNALGERVRKDDSSGGKKYTWDGLDVIAEKNLSNTTTQRLVKGYTMIPGIGAYAMQDIGGTIIYPHKNQVGTTMRHTNGSQVVTNTYEYDAWGVPLVVTEGAAQQYRFTGKELDLDFIAFQVQNRRYHFPARIYLSTRAVFAQIDSPSVSLVMLPYVYCAGNPLWFVDPLGLQQVPIQDLPELTKGLAGDDERKREAASAIASGGPPTGAAKKSCKYEDGTLAGRGVGPEGGYHQNKQNQISKLTKLEFKVEMGADPKCCCLVNWLNASETIDGKLAKGVLRDLYGYKGVQADTRGKWAVDQSASMDPKYPLAKVEGNYAYAVDAPTYDVKSPKGRVKDVKFKICIYNCEDLANVQVQPYRVSDADGTTIIGIINVPAIACADWTFKVSTDQAGKIVY